MLVLLQMYNYVLFVGFKWLIVSVLGSFLGGGCLFSREVFVEGPFKNVDLTLLYRDNFGRKTVNQLPIVGRDDDGFFERREADC